ncbi:hypothetical protein GQ457_12G020390 [Hibiscus cannabinus]
MEDHNEYSQPTIPDKFTNLNYSKKLDHQLCFEKEWSWLCSRQRQNHFTLVVFCFVGFDMLAKPHEAIYWGFLVITRASTESAQQLLLLAVLALMGFCRIMIWWCW